VSEKETQVADSHNKISEAEQFGELAHERREAMRDALERAERKHKTRHSEREVLAKARELAKKVETADSNKSTSPAERRKGPIGKKQLESSFKTQMKYAKNDMTFNERVISTIIHAKPVEKTADFVSATIARPNAMLSGSIAAFIGITALYFISKYYGFQLSGFETIGAFIAGWIVGILYDYFSVMIRGPRK